MDSRVKSKPNAKDQLLEEWKSKFTDAFEWEKEWRRDKKDWERFYDGDQLSDEEKEALNLRGQPEVVINKIKGVIDGIIGIQLGGRTVVKAIPRGQLDFETAKVIAEALRYIEDSCEFEDHQADAFEDALVPGRGWYKHEVVFEDKEPEFRTYRVDPDDIFLDPYCKKADLTDAKYIFESVWVDLEDAKELFPDYVDELEEAVVDPANSSLESLPETHQKERPDQYKSTQNQRGNQSLFVDCGRKRVRLVAAHYRETKRFEYATHSELGTQDVTEMKPNEKKKITKLFPEVPEKNIGPVVFHKSLETRLNTIIFTENCILEHKKNVRHWDSKAKFPFVQVPAFVTKNDKRKPYGYVKQLMDPQKEVNKRRSKMLHLLNVVQLVGEEGAVADWEHAKTEAAKPDGVLVYQPDRKFDVVRGVELVQPHFMMYQEAKREIEEAGVNREITGTPSQATSARQVQVRQQQVIQSLRKLFKNLRGAHRRVAMLWLDDMQHYWKGEKFVAITDDPESAFVLNQVVTDEMGNPVMGPDGQPVVANKVNVGKYDIKIEETEDTLNLQQETFQTLSTLAGTGRVPIPPDMLVEASPLPNKKQLIERMKQQEMMQMQMLQAQAAAQGGQPPPRG